MAEIGDWINTKLSKFLSFPAPPDLIDYICTINNEKDFQEYFTSLLNYNDPEQVAFVNELAQKLLSRGGQASEDKENFSNKNPPVSSREQFPAISSAPLSQVEQAREPAKKKESFPSLSKKEVTPPKETSPKEQQNSSGKKQKTKFVNLYSTEGRQKDVITLPGRHKCTCEATKHALINNCLSCGRIVCAQEGAGPCMFCGKLVCTKDQAKIVGRGSKKSEKLIQHLMKHAEDPKMDKAVEKKNKLLEYDKQNFKLTRVIDDQKDFFATSTWQSEKERSHIQKKEQELMGQRYGSRRDKKFTLDFSGRRVVEDEIVEEQFNPEDDPILKQIRDDALKSIVRERPANDTNPALLTHKPTFVEVGITPQSGKGNESRIGLLEGRIQDKEMLEMSDQAKCLSMHQPWASLLVRGIKKHEGRSWYTKHRGPLWIAAAAKVPTEDEIAEIEKAHSHIAQKENLDFPKNYPVSCLLGKVNVADCLPQDEYRAAYPDGLSESPFVFICENTEELPFFLPIKGQHKIFTLDKALHHAAVTSLKRKGLLQSKKRLDAAR
ncbi:activating signal cointegrator 1 isoform X2 [Neocloeon triangulifer]|nr:activating signal cointegrator 1 isoform X2 [Neocloeon triangulifer]XP_059486170.1 activating signal cointegrator 1 isoform X2 [Neocloeon triangulifer]XP_059486176.1 activating signal cointegrator 1 isoform X2 [Neocloeon triangulifer]